MSLTGPKPLLCIFKIHYSLLLYGRSIHEHVMHVIHMTLRSTRSIFKTHRPDGRDARVRLSILWTLVSAWVKPGSNQRLYIMIYFFSAKQAVSKCK
jgi:hypothetical protein